MHHHNDEENIIEKKPREKTIHSNQYSTHILIESN